MTETATVWPGQEVVQWPGQEVKTGQGEHGYAPAPSEPPPPRWVNDVSGEYGPPSWANAEASPPAWATTMGSSLLPDALTKVPESSRWPEAAAEAFRETKPILTPRGEEIVGQYGPRWVPGGEPIINTLFQLGGVGLGLFNAATAGVGTGIKETATRYGVPRLGEDINTYLQVAPLAHTALGNPRLPGPRIDPAVAPRVSPMMEAFDRAEAIRAEQPSRFDPATSGIARTQSQIGIRPEPPPPPAATPAESAPGFVPRANLDPMTGEVIPTRVPQTLQVAAVRAADAAPEPKPDLQSAMGPPPPRPDPALAAGPRTLREAEPPPSQPGSSAQADLEARMRSSAETLRQSREARGAEQPQPGTVPEPPPVPQSVGAAASREGTPASELGLTPQQEAAYRSTAEGNKLLEPQEPGFRDDKQYLPGERINEAQASQDVEVARELNSLREQTPELDKAMTADENHNNNIRTNAINNAIPGKVQITAARDARQAVMDANEPKIFGNATDADVRPIVKEIQDILNEPKNLENSQLKQYVRPLIARLLNPDGTLKITNPVQLWSWRQDVQHLTSGAAQAADPNLSRISGLLGRVLDKTDNQIEAAAPGYKAGLLEEYRTRSREIDAMEALNAERFKLFDSQNKPNYNAVQSLMRRIIDARQANDPYDPFTHVTPDTLNDFWNIRDSMRRQAAVDRLGKPRGSPTSQNVGDALRIAGKMALQTAAPAIGATIGQLLIPIPGVGPVAGIAAGATLNHFLSSRALGQRLTRGLELTNPNRLMHPLP